MYRCAKPLGINQALLVESNISWQVDLAGPPCSGYSRWCGLPCALVQECRQQLQKTIRGDCADKEISKMEWHVYVVKKYTGGWVRWLPFAYRTSQKELPSRHLLDGYDSRCHLNYKGMKKRFTLTWAAMVYNSANVLLRTAGRRAGKVACKAACIVA